MREIGGRKDFLGRASPSVRFGRGFFSSMSETVSTCCFAGAGGGVAAAAAAAACAAARERAAGVRVEGIGAAVLAVPEVLALFTPLAGASAEAADLTAVFRAAGADLRAAVFVDVVRVGIDWKNFHGSQAAN
jgi:F0F1-type ATP synthase membrane subunit c/vacuolar-type H+-ATPase subunit K